MVQGVPHTTWGAPAIMRLAAAWLRDRLAADG